MFSKKLKHVIIAVVAIRNEQIVQAGDAVDEVDGARIEIAGQIIRHIQYERQVRRGIEPVRRKLIGESV